MHPCSDFFLHRHNSSLDIFLEVDCLLWRAGTITDLQRRVTRLPSGRLDQFTLPPSQGPFWVFMQPGRPPALHLKTLCWVSDFFFFFELSHFSFETSAYKALNSRRENHFLSLMRDRQGLGTGHFDGTPPCVSNMAHLLQNHTNLSARSSALRQPLLISQGQKDSKGKVVVSKRY